jgi:hypothetical protein
MAMFFVPIALCLLGWLAVAVHRSLSARRVPRPWMAGFYGSLLVGAVIGIYFGFFFRYHVSPRMLIYSFPIPTACLVLERHDDGTERWTDFITPAPMLFASANVIIFACLSVIPVWIVNTVARSRGG